MKKKDIRGFSAGTVLMLIATGVILCVSIYMISRFSSGQHVDISTLTMQVFALNESGSPDMVEDIPVHSDSSESVTVTENGKKVNETPTITAEETHAPQKNEIRTFTITAGGTVALETNSRKSGYSNDSKKYDFTNLMNLLSPYITADINTVFLENLLMDDEKVSKTIVPTCAADMLKTAGFDTVAAGFAKAWEKKEDGVNQTRVALRSAGLSTLGIFNDANDAAPEIMNINGIRVALVQYTDTVAVNTRKNMIQNGNSRMVPDTDQAEILEDLRYARDQADVVVVLIQWGKTNAKSPSKTETELAQYFANAGADIIIGSGIRSVQRMEYLTGTREDGSEHQVFCAYSLGALLSDDRASAAKIGSCLLNLRITCDEKGNINVAEATYTPTYIWKYKQDSMYYYRVLAADADVPDGMDNDQIKVMQKALNSVRKALEGSPVTER